MRDFSIFLLRRSLIGAKERWMELSSDYDCETRPPRKVNVVADALTRKERIKSKGV